MYVCMYLEGGERREEAVPVGHAHLVWCGIWFVWVHESAGPDDAD